MRPSKEIQDLVEAMVNSVQLDDISINDLEKWIYEYLFVRGLTITEREE